MNIFEHLTEEYQRKAQALGIKQEDLSEQFVRGSGKGGQKINKTSNTVLLRHLPTGLEVRVQRHRELFNNRLSAYKLLIKKIEEKKLGRQSEIQKKIFKLRKQKQKRSKKAKEKMLEAKKRRAEIKEGRKASSY
jgi:protein subunit release factor B